MPHAETALVERYLEHVRVEKRLAARTVTLYALHLQQLADKAAAVPVDLLQVHNAHIRRWVAQLHSAGRSGSGIALVLSCWRGFYTWLGREGRERLNRWPSKRQRVWIPQSPAPRPLSRVTSSWRRSS